MLKQTFNLQVQAISTVWAVPAGITRTGAQIKLDCYFMVLDLTRTRMTYQKIQFAQRTPTRRDLHIAGQQLPAQHFCYQAGIEVLKVNPETLGSSLLQYPYKPPASGQSGHTLHPILWQSCSQIKDQFMPDQ